MAESQEPKKKPGRPRKSAAVLVTNTEELQPVVPAVPAAKTPVHRKPKPKVHVKEEAIPEVEVLLEAEPKKTPVRHRRPKKEASEASVAAEIPAEPVAAALPPLELFQPEAQPEPLPKAPAEIPPTAQDQQLTPPQRRSSRKRKRRPAAPEPAPTEIKVATGADAFNDDSAVDMDLEDSVDSSAEETGEGASNPSAAPESRGRRRRGRTGNGRRSEVSDTASNWCSRRWLEQLEKYSHGHDARQRWMRGKVYARRGQVLEIEVGPNGLLAKVQGSRPKPYQVRMELNKLRREAWGRVLIAVAGKAQYTARLLAGELPPEIESVFSSAGARLFPAGESDFRTKCSCPDPLSPCKHVAAVYHAMAAALEQDPFLLFSLRGKSKAQFLQDLRDMRFRAQKGSKQPDYTQEEISQIANFWRMGRLNESAFVRDTYEPGDPARLLHTLGDPPIAVVRAGMAMPVFESTYRQVSEAVQRLPKDN